MLLKVGGMEEKKMKTIWTSLVAAVENRLLHVVLDEDREPGHSVAIDEKQIWWAPTRISDFCRAWRAPLNRLKTCR